MALKVAEGISIPEFAGEPPGGTDLSMPQIFQEQTNWCWAACAEMVSNHYGFDVPQCTLASEGPGGGAACCTAPASTVCNRPWSATQPYDNHGILHNDLVGFCSAPTVQVEIDAGRPVEVYYAWAAGGAHVALITGYDGLDLLVNDPAYGKGLRNYAFVVAAYGLGAWSLTYTGLRPPVV
jgi:hypothetical protein